jgi:hypothetical protein
MAPQLFREDPKEAPSIIEEQVGDSLVRDFIWLTVTREVDPGSYKYCERIQESALGERCRVLVSRPHLHRALLESAAGEAGKTPGDGKAGGPGPQGGGEGVPRTQGSRPPMRGGGPSPGQAPPAEKPPGLPTGEVQGSDGEEVTGNKPAAAPGSDGE